MSPKKSGEGFTDIFRRGKKQLTKEEKEKAKKEAAAKAAAKAAAGKDV